MMKGFTLLIKLLSEKLRNMLLFSIHCKDMKIERNSQNFKDICSIGTGHIR